MSNPEATHRGESVAPHSPFWNVPNSISLARVGIAVFVCIALEFQAFGVAFVLFFIAAISDALDGYLARMLGQVTAIGRQLDPLVDKIIVISTLCYLIAFEGSGVKPWMAAVVVARELLVQAIRSVIEGQGEPFGAKWAGKLKMIAQCTAVLASIATLDASRGGEAPSWLSIGRDASLWLMVGLTIVSGLSYLMAGWPRLTRGV